GLNKITSPPCRSHPASQTAPHPSIPAVRPLLVAKRGGPRPVLGICVHVMRACWGKGVPPPAAGGMAHDLTRLCQQGGRRLRGTRAVGGDAREATTTRYPIGFAGGYRRPLPAPAPCLAQNERAARRRLFQILCQAGVRDQNAIRMPAMTMSMSCTAARA